MAIFRPKPSQIFFFGLVPKSPIHIGWIYVKNPKPNISCLGPFKDTYHSNHTVIERLYGQSTLPACTVCSKKLCFAWIDVYKGCHLNFCISIGLVSAWVGQFCLNRLYRFIARKICLYRQKCRFIAQN